MATTPNNPSTPPAPTVDNLPLPFPSSALREREVAAMEKQAESLRRTGEIIQATAGIGPLAMKERYERLVIACIHGRVATDLQGILKFAEELLEGIELRYPDPPITS